MKTAPLSRDYTFEEWTALSVEDQWRVCVHFWSLFTPEQGKATRNAIIHAFLKEYPHLKNASAVGFGWIGRCVDSIFVVVADPAIPVPSMFSIFTVNKGLLKTKLLPEEWVVDW